MKRMRVASRWLLFPILLACACAWSAETIRYVALVDGGKRAGQQVVSHRDDGVTTVEFTFKDNGRGPELKEQYTLAEDGTFKTYTVKGTSTFGAPVEETFSIADGKAQWKSTSDRGEARVAAGAQYAPLGGTPQGISAALAALSKRIGDGLPLIPSGTLRMRKVP
ncbi:MAG: hypothetical protein ACREO8_11455, partial [Luteimonas sp.]